MNTWVPARTLADPKAILLGLVVGLAVGSAGTYLAVSRLSAAGGQADGNWRHAAAWAKDPRFSVRQKTALAWHESHSDDPVIELLEFEDSRIAPQDDRYSVVTMRIREKVSGSPKERILTYMLYPDGRCETYDHRIRSATGSPVKDGVVIQGRQP